MKKAWKIVGIILAALFGIFVIFIVEESIRLSKNMGALPAVVIDQTKCDPTCAEPGGETNIEYFGLGYKLDIRYYMDEESSEDNCMYQITKKEFYLFNKIRLWILVS